MNVDRKGGNRNDRSFERDHQPAGFRYYRYRDRDRLTNLVESIFLKTSETGVTGLSTFGGVIVVFAGVSLAIGLSRWVVNWVTSLGASH